MNRSHLPPAAFVDPIGGPDEAVEAFVGGAVGRALRFAAGASRRPPLPAKGGETPTATIPDRGRPAAELLDDLDRLLAGSMNPAHPGWIGHMDPMPALASVIADFAAALVNNNMLSLEMSPALTRLEGALVRELADLFGLGKRAGGSMLSGGTLANLQALTVARNAAFDVAGSRLPAGEGRPVVHASELAHTSIEKAAMVSGLGRDAVRRVAVDEDFRMRPDALARSLDEAELRGDLPFCVVATAGTTATGSVDPLGEIAEVTRERGLWLHVDAAHGGALAFSASHRTELEGIERADSISFNPQKWLYVAKTCAVLLFRDRETWKRHFRIGAPYMERSDALENLGEVGVQGSRHADALKLWATLQHLGRRGIAQLIDEGVRLAGRLAELVQARRYLVLAHRPGLNIVCFRGQPPWIGTDDRDRWNAGLQAHLLQDRQTFLSLPTIRGKRWLRAVLLNPYASESTLEDMFEGVDEYAERSRSE